MALCKVCNHQARAEIEAALLGGESFRPLASRYDVSIAALSRHQANHMAGAIAKAKDTRDAAHGETMMAQIEELMSDAAGIKNQALEAQDLRIALSAIDKMDDLIRTKGMMLLKAEELRRQQAASEPLRVEIQIVDPGPDARTATEATKGVRQ